MTGKERSGWRDQEISARHRDWGTDCPAVDIDFFLTEYNHGKPVALIEYKLYTVDTVDVSKPSYQALIDLANNYGGKGGPLPALLVFYWPVEWAFCVHPLNESAKRF